MVRWVGIVLVGSAFWLGFGGQKQVSANPQVSSVLGAPLNAVESNPYDSWKAIDTQRNPETADRGDRTWQLQKSEPAAISFGDTRLDSIYEFVQDFPVQLNMGGAVIPGIIQAEW